MQKVEGSNPFSRLFGNALHVGGLGSTGEPETKWNHPRISPPFWALVPKMTPMGGDERRLRVDSTLHWPRRLGGGRAATYP